MMAILNFKSGKQIYEVVYERDRNWIVLPYVGRIELDEDDVLYIANTVEELEELAPEYFI